MSSFFGNSATDPCYCSKLSEQVSPLSGVSTRSIPPVGENTCNCFSPSTDLLSSLAPYSCAMPDGLRVSFGFSLKEKSAFPIPWSTFDSAVNPRQRTFRSHSSLASVATASSTLRTPLLVSGAPFLFCRYFGWLRAPAPKERAKTNSKREFMSSLMSWVIEVESVSGIHLAFGI